MSQTASCAGVKVSVKKILLMLFATAAVLSLGALHAAESAQYPDDFSQWSQ
jgi:hypothetical protein